MATRSWDPTWCKRWGSNPLAPQSPGFTGPVPYLHGGGACEMAEETGVEPACARIS